MIICMGLFNRPSEKEKRRTLRNNMPEAEVMLWKKLKGKQVNGHKFRRQYSIGKYIVDFFCPELKLAVEVDGDSHFMDEACMEKDRKRQFFIEKQGISFYGLPISRCIGSLKAFSLPLKIMGRRRQPHRGLPLQRGGWAKRAKKAKRGNETPETCHKAEISL